MPAHDADHDKTRLSFAGAALYVDDVPSVLEFYGRAFGLETVHWDEQFGYGELEAGGAHLGVASHQLGEMLMPGRYSPPPPGARSDVEIGFFVSDVEAAFRRAVDAGATPLAEPRKMPWGATVAYLRSIEGTLIGLNNPMQEWKKDEE